VRKLITIGVGAMGAAGVAIALVGAGTAAAAPDVSGQTYAKAKQALSGAGLTPIIATRVGDRVSEDDCIVDRVQDANFVSGTGTAAASTVKVYLNCYGSVAANNKPGYSNQDPMGKTVKSKEEEAASGG
jgi:beta-lactam-binding protein with PASTA domain